ncbi:MAG: protein-glutamate O-methyltransferase CheR [Gemmatimonadaceae bacterium]|nr:protein-glutamate O-methyltransferase CheR [Gemmatimonadaceae bacterium]
MIAPDDYRFLSDFLKRESGLSLGPGKDYLLESRLPPVAANFACDGVAGLVRALRMGGNRAMVKAVADAMTTGETLFFRDQTPFTVFRETLLPEAVQRARPTGRPVRIWSAACSSGQEVFSLAMIADEQQRQLAGTRVEFLATDYSTPTVQRAAQATFSQLEVQRGLPIQLLVKYFDKTPDGFRVKDMLKQRVAFREHNLLTSGAGHGSFDIIFVRNVLIYFDVPTKREVLERLSAQLVPGGVIVLGGTENTLGVTDALVRLPGCPTAVYQRSADLTQRRAAPAA